MTLTEGVPGGPTTESCAHPAPEISFSIDCARSLLSRYVEDADTSRSMELWRDIEEGEAGKGFLGRPEEKILLLPCVPARVDKEGMLEETGILVEGGAMPEQAFLSP